MTLVSLGKTFVPVLLATCIAPARAQDGDATTTRERPRLVVMLVVDQLYPEQLERLEPWLEGGLARLLAAGRFYTLATHDHANTETAPGHATLATGLYPCHHGIVGNEFFDRESGQPTYCVADPDVAGLRGDGSEGGGKQSSPRRLRALGIGDHLRRLNERSHVVSIAGKDRSAVLLGGQQADWAFWWDTHGGFSSSTWYGERLPEWMIEWNASWRERASGWVWEELFPDGLPGSGTAVDDRAGEGGARHVFPYRYPRLEADAAPQKVAQLAGAVFSTPLLDSFVVDVALESIDALALGQDEIPDLLCLGFSACDAVGHAFGPTSREVTDLLLRVDRELARLFEGLDERAGENGWIACLSSDHGVLDLPEALQSRGVGAVRLKMGAIGELVQAVRGALESLYQNDFGVTWTEGLVFDARAIEAAGVEAEEVRRAARDVALSMPWIERAFTLGELISAGPDGDEPWTRLAARSVTAARGADVLIQLPPFHLLGFATGTSHGSPYPYDRRIPLLFYGPRVRPGRSYEPASSVDALPTLFAELGLDVPAGLDGRVLPLE